MRLTERTIPQAHASLPKGGARDGAVQETQVPSRSIHFPDPENHVFDARRHLRGVAGCLAMVRNLAEPKPCR